MQEQIILEKAKVCVVVPIDEERLDIIPEESLHNKTELRHNIPIQNRV